MVKHDDSVGIFNFFSGLRERTRFSWTPRVACIVYMKSRGGRTWKEMGRTELIENTLEPEWSKTFLLDYYFEEKQVRFAPSF